MSEHVRAFFVEVTPVTSEVFQKFAFQKGFTWASGDKITRHLESKVLVMEPWSGNRGRMSIRTRTTYPSCANLPVLKLSLEDALAELCKPVYHPIMVGHNAVVCQVSGSVTVGCTTVDSETVDAIIERRKKVMWPIEEEESA